MPANPLLIFLFSAFFDPSAAAATPSAAAATPSATAATPSAAMATPTRDTSGLLVSGSADLYYRYDLAKTDKNELTSFTQSNNQFNLGMAEIKLERKTTRVDMVADLAAGPREREYAYTDKGITQAIKQLDGEADLLPAYPLLSGQACCHSRKP